MLRAGSRTLTPLLVLIAVAAASTAVIATDRLRAQTLGGQSVVFSGTIRDSINAPPPPFSTLKLIVGTPKTGSGPQFYCALGSADSTGNFRLQLENLSPACNVPGTLLTLLVNGTPASPSVTVPAAGGVYNFNFTLPVPLGGQPLPTATPMLPVLQPPAQTPTPTQTTQLDTGCSLVVVSLGIGATAAQVAGLVANPALELSIWHYDNARQQFSGYFPNSGAPSDLGALAPLDSVFICVSAPTSITAP